MDHTVTLKQAQTFATLLPALMRQLMAGVNDPAVELPLAQLRVCSILGGGPRPMSALSRELGVSLSAMTQIADRLERARLVKRVTLGNDRRVRRLRLTERGKKIMQLHEDARVERALAVLEHLAPQAREEALATFETLIRACVATRERDGHPHNLPQQPAHDRRAERSEASGVPSCRRAPSLRSGRHTTAAKVL